LNKSTKKYLDFISTTFYFDVMDVFQQMEIRVFNLGQQLLMMFDL